MTMTWREVIATARLAACRRERYFTTAIMALIPHEAPGLGTVAVTKDWVMLVDPEAVVAWGVEATTTAIRHEVRHCLRDHHGRGALLGADDEENQWLKNIAADAEINDGAEFQGDVWPSIPGDPNSGPIMPSKLTPPMPDGLLFEEYYAKLREQQEKQPKQGKQGKPGGPGSGGGQGKPGDKKEDGKGGKSGSAPGQGEQKPRPGGGWCGSCAGHAVPNEPSTEGKGAGKDGDKDGKGGEHGPVEGRSEVEQRRIIKQVAESIQQEAARGRGTAPGSWARWADTQLKPPKIPWQQKLAKVMRATIAYRAGAIDRKYSHPSRRQAGIGHGVGMPRLPGLRAPVPNVAVVVDTSGSMGTEEGKTAISESAGVLKAVGADVTFCAIDAQVHSLAKVRNVRDLVKLIKGGGGTDFRPAFDALAKQKRPPEIVIFITDGCGPAPEKEPEGMRTIWVLVGPSRQRPCKWGDAIEVDS